MAFIAGTPVLTNNGWKNIEDISGHDKVLVLNFLGDAEFIQPFALKNKKYDGEIVSFGTAYSNISVTPNHKISYEYRRKSVTVDAGAFIPSTDNKLFRKFRYNPEDRVGEKLHLKDEFSERVVRISAEHWYIISAYTFFKGYISKDKHPMLKYMLTTEEQVNILVGILDFYGISWGRTSNAQGSPVITVNRNSNLANKLKKNFGARARRDMRIPKKIIYGSSRSLTRVFVETIKLLTGRVQKNCHIFRTINQKLAEDLKMLGMFGGYEVKYYASKGFDDVISNTVSISNVAEMSAPQYSKRENYSGVVYEIDLFDGQIYIKQGSQPIWINPK